MKVPGRRNSSLGQWPRKLGEIVTSEMCVKVKYEMLYNCNRRKLRKLVSD